jgi:sporulation protein YlmC with PRC-barrel domain
MREVHVYEFLGKKVTDSEGIHIGRLEEIEAARGEESCAIEAYLVEHRGLLDRISSWALSPSLRRILPKGEKSKPFRVPWDQMDLSDPAHPRVLVSKSDLRRVRD